MVGFGTSASKDSLSRRVIVGVGDMAVANDAAVTLSTFALGSCIGVVAFHPESGVGGMLHIMLPTSRVSEEKARFQPYLFADTGMDRFRSTLATMGADVDKLRVVVAGGASVMSANDAFRIGEKNIDAVNEKLSEFGIRAVASHLGGLSNRSLDFHLGSGVLKVRLPDQIEEVVLS